MARKMKDSGIEWIGEIPEDWNVRKGKTLYTIQTGKLDANAANLEGEYPFFTCSMFPKKIDNYAFDCEALLVAGNGLVGFTQYYNGKFNAYQRTYVLSDFNNVEPQYLKYYVTNLLSVAVEPDSVGSVITFIKLGDLQNFYVSMPETEEQQKIANFLDEKVGEIDTIIVKTKESIEEYKKYKQAVITETITMGLDKNVTYKPTNIEYIKKIPAHWDVMRLRFLGSCQNGISKGSDAFGSGYPFVSYGDVYRNYELPETVSGLIETTESDRENYSVKYGDVFFTRTSETIEEVGFTSTCLKTIDNAVFAGFVIRFRPFNDEKLNPHFSKYYFRSDIHRRFFVKEMNLVTRASLSQELLKKLPVLLPPLEEQQEIAKYLDEKCGEIDALIAKKEAFIEEMENYKKSLIYEYVTGKKEVPS